MAINQISKRIAAIARKPAPTPVTPPQQEQERSVSRLESFKFGTITTESFESIDCIIQDHSEDGVRVKLRCAYPLSKTVHLAVPVRCINARVEVIWQEDDLVGLKIIK